MHEQDFYLPCVMCILKLDMSLFVIAQKVRGLWLITQRLMQVPKYNRLLNQTYILHTHCLPNFK